MQYIYIYYIYIYIVIFFFAKTFSPDDELMSKRVKNNEKIYKHYKNNIPLSLIALIHLYIYNKNFEYLDQGLTP